MTRISYLAIFLMLLASCTKMGHVDVGLNDDPNYTAATFGDMSIRVLKIEIGAGSEYSTIWEGSNVVVVPVSSQDFISITNDYVDVTPGSYNRIRITVDSMSYIAETSSMLILDSTLLFTASSFSDIEVGTTEMRLVVDIASANWFDTSSQSVISSLFDGATFRESY